MPRPKLPPRVNGPYVEKRGFRIRIFDGIGGHEDLFFATVQEAHDAKKAAEQTLPRQVTNLSLSDLLSYYWEDKVRLGKCKSETAKEQRAQLSRFLQDCLDGPVSRMSATRATALYQEFVETPLHKTGKPPQAATHRFTLKLAQSFFQWAVREGHAAANPFKEVKPVGRVNRGKPQLRFEEAGQFISAGLRLYETKEDVLALAAVTALLLGLRASEVLSVRVRDLDCGGTKLWVATGDGYRGKTENARRAPDVPTVISGHLLKLATGHSPDAYLFGDPQTGRPRCRQVLHRAVHRVCEAAGVPRVCPHSLRGLWATAGVSSGAMSHAVAAALGHGSFEVTEKHYVAPGTMGGVRTTRLVEMLELNGPSPTPGPAAPSELAHLSVEELLRKLPAEKLAQLVAAASKPRA